MVVRAWGVGLALVLASGAAAYAEPRTFGREDYERYFSPGRFQSHASYYQSYGLFEVTSNKPVERLGKYVLEQSTHTLDVSPNYDVLSTRVYYKIESRTTEQMVWDDARKLYIYEYTNKDFDSNDSIVWESKNNKIEVSREDISRGLLHAFYRDADKRAKQDVKALDDQYRHDVVGMWTMQCAYIKDAAYDVDCTVMHQPTRRIEHYFYRKLDLIG